jgi:hypothetical protein
LYGDGGALGAVGREHAERHRKMSNDLKNIEVDARSASATARSLKKSIVQHLYRILRNTYVTFLHGRRTKWLVDGCEKKK